MKAARDWLYALRRACGAAVREWRRVRRDQQPRQYLVGKQDF